MRTPDLSRYVPRGGWRKVSFARELDHLPVGTLLSFPHSNLAAVRGQNGWLLTGRSGDETQSVIRNLPAQIERLGSRVAGDNQ